ncbi:hypothetical protein NDU88_001357 [Pleurodeles waltl]|uniref:Uncharacterized protein n=1 Tax=Pleurodeles waltl TaxID=8319 RepID=A0AAV7VW82_PLEWA|nr:hypothetical protein NDU88_001357 [Pleurodeles waltl]
MNPLAPPCWALDAPGDIKGKHDVKQANLTFERRKHKRLADMPLEALLRIDSQEPPPEPDISTMRRVFKHSLTAINTKIYLVTDSSDQLKDKFGKHDERLNQLLHQTLEIDDGPRSNEKLLQMERVLEVIHNKNERLEVRSQKCNLCILGVPESTEMGLIEDYQE